LTATPFRASEGEKKKKKERESRRQRGENIRDGAGEKRSVVNARPARLREEPTAGHHELYLRQQHPVPPQREGGRVLRGSGGLPRSQTEAGAPAALLRGARTSAHLLPLLLLLHLLLPLAAAPHVLLQEECLHGLYHRRPGNAGASRPMCVCVGVCGWVGVCVCVCVCFTLEGW